MRMAATDRAAASGRTDELINVTNNGEQKNNNTSVLDSKKPKAIRSRGKKIDYGITELTHFSSLPSLQYTSRNAEKPAALACLHRKQYRTQSSLLICTTLNCAYNMTVSLPSDLANHRSRKLSLIWSTLSRQIERNHSSAPPDNCGVRQLQLYEMRPSLIRT